MFVRLQLALFSVLLLWPALALAYLSPGTPSGFVNDYSGLLETEEKARLEIKLADFQASTSNELAVVIIDTLDGDSIENYAEELFREWGIGQKGRDNGALLLVAKDDRQMRIEVGYGLEPVLTDAQSSQIINNILRPAFSSGDFAGGIETAADDIIGIINGQPLEISTKSNGNSNASLIQAAIMFSFFFAQLIAAFLAKSKSWWVGGIIGGFFALAVGFFFSYLWAVASALILVPFGLLIDYALSHAYQKNKTTKSGPWWLGGPGGSSGGSFGGFGGFGGGSSGGGGASGRW